MKIFVPPLKWDKVVDGPDAAGSHRWISEFERTQLPRDTIFPKPGQVWQAIRDCEVRFVATLEFSDASPPKKGDFTDAEIMTWFASDGWIIPFPTGPARLAKGEKVRIVESNSFTDDSCTRPLHVNFRTLRHKELEDQIVSQKLRDKPEYRDYALQIATARPRACLGPEDSYLNEDFKLVG